MALDTEAAPSVLGIVTIEDIFEELIQAEVIFSLFSMLKRTLRITIASMGSCSCRSLMRQTNLWRDSPLFALLNSFLNCVRSSMTALRISEV